MAVIDTVTYYPNTKFQIDGETVNVKQQEFIRTVFKCLKGSLPYRYLFYGGAIRGGKSYVVSFILHLLCLKFPGSVWAVVRKDLPTLKNTSIPTFLKMLGSENRLRHGVMYWSSPISFNYNNGSKILFISENLSGDPELDSFLGFECNGIFLEQVEELSFKMLQRALERVGSNILTPMPVPFIFGTLNPTNRWFKKEVYDKWARNELKAPWFYLPALPGDNPFVTKEQWENWKNLGSREYAQRVESDWSVTMIKDNRFVYAFDRVKHVNPANNALTYDKTLPLYLSFDFNVNPITCLVGQHDVRFTKVRFLKEYRLPNSNTYDLCELVSKHFDTRVMYITGDGSGWSRDARSKGSLCNYDIIKQVLKLNSSQILTPRSNPLHTATRTLSNAILDRHPDILFNDLPFLISDLENVQCNSEGGIKKEVGDAGHLLDCFLYYCFTFGKSFLNLKSI